MKSIRSLVVRWGSASNPWLLTVGAVALNVYWVIVLQALNRQFQQLAGYPLLDLQNDLAPATIMTPARFMEQIATYSLEAKSFYWVFFILDTIFPPLVFSSIALLWAYLLKSNPNPLFDRLLQSYFVLIPVGVGVFDWFENLGYIVAINSYPGALTMPAIYLGLAFKWIKAACVFPTFPILLLLVARHLWRAVRRRKSEQPSAETLR